MELYKEGNEREGRYISSRMQHMNLGSRLSDSVDIQRHGNLLETSYNHIGNSPGISADIYSSSESWSMAQDFLNSGSPPNHRLDPILETNNIEPRHHDERHQPMARHRHGDEWDVGHMRRRVNSMPRHHRYNNPEPKLLTRNIRRFRITPKGLLSRESQDRTSINDIDDHRPQSINQSGNDDGPLEHHKVLFLGSAGVGKRALIRLFADENDSENGSFDDDSEKKVSVILDGRESTLEFEDLSDQKVDLRIRQEHADAYVVVYSVEDRRSYEASINRLLEIREAIGRHVALILVANKTDLVRCRVVTGEEGHAAAKTYDSKYIEVSAAIDLKIDELLVGVLQQIRLHKQKYERSGCHRTLLDSLHFHRARHNALTKMLKGRHQSSKSYDNLYVL